MEEKYFVGSDVDQPERIYFDKTSAFANEHYYVDSFDETGKWVQAYKFLDGVYIIDGSV